MNVTLRMRPTSLDSIVSLRERYLDELPFAQDAFLESLVSDSRPFLIEYKGRSIGYCALFRESVLVEYHLVESAVYLAQSAFPKVVKALGIKKALVKSFDAVALVGALDLASSTRVKGMLVRSYVPRELPTLPHIKYSKRVALRKDLERVLGLDQDVFSDEERVVAVIEAKQMLLFEQEETLIGFGILRPVIPGRKDVEVGIAVDKPFRNRGYAAYILRDLVETCLSRGKNPVSGCSIDNVASIRLGQRIGLCSRHRLLEIQF